MTKYVAVFGTHNGRIISVYADDAEEAEEKVIEQLDRPGRRDALKRWIDDGKKLIEES